MNLHIAFGQVQRDTSSDLISEAHVTEESDNGVQNDDGSHGHIQDSGASKEVLGLAHRVLHRHHSTDSLHSKDNRRKEERLREDKKQENEIKMNREIISLATHHLGETGHAGLIVEDQGHIEHVVQGYSKGDDNKEIGHSAEWHQVPQLADLADQQDWE